MSIDLALVNLYNFYSHTSRLSEQKAGPVLPRKRLLFTAKQASLAVQFQSKTIGSLSGVLVRKVPSHVTQMPLPPTHTLNAHFWQSVLTSLVNDLCELRIHPRGNRLEGADGILGIEHTHIRWKFLCHRDVEGRGSQTFYFFFQGTFLTRMPIQS